MLTIKKLFRKTYDALSSVYGREALELTYFIFENVLKKNKVEITLVFDQKAEAKILNAVNKAVLLLKSNYPVQYIFNTAHCYGLDFYVDESVLIPRQETAQLIDLILTDFDFSAKPEIIDLGTGSGCIAINLKKNTDSEVWAVDISEDALKTAEFNAKKHSAKINFLKADLLKNPSLNRSFDIIVSNPPYVREKEKIFLNKNIFFEPANALFVTDEKPLVFYEAILNFALKHLKNQGKIYLELNEFLADQIKNLFEKSSFKTKIFTDLNEKKRFLIAWK